MKNNILSFFALALIFTAISCAGPENDKTLAAAAADDLSSIEVTSRNVELDDQEEDIQFLLVRKWQNESGEIFMDLKIDGSFEGKFNQEEIVTGTWDVSDDQKTLELKGDKSREGKGTSFKTSFKVLDMSLNNMKVQDQEGKEIIFTAPND